MITEQIDIAGENNNTCIPLLKQESPQTSEDEGLATDHEDNFATDGVEAFKSLKPDNENSGKTGKGRLLRRKRRKLRQKARKRQFKEQIKKSGIAQEKANATSLVSFISSRIYSCDLSLKVESTQSSQLDSTVNYPKEENSTDHQLPNHPARENCRESSSLKSRLLLLASEYGTANGTECKLTVSENTDMTFSNLQRNWPRDDFSSSKPLPLGIREILEENPKCTQKDFSSQVEFDLQPWVEKTTLKGTVNVKFQYPDSFKGKFSHDTMSGYRAPKSIKSLQNLLLEHKLKHFFKCCHYTCSYSSDNLSDVALHLLSHIDTELFCIYCGIIFDTAKSLLDHMTNMHVKRVYQCRKCLYRAMSRKHVIFHFRNVHRGEALILKCQEIQYSKSNSAEKLSEVLPFKCSFISCQFKAIDPEVFLTHCLLEHKTASKFKCYLCNEKFPSPYDIMFHFKTHNCDVFQCAYCVYCSEHMNEMENHVCHYHADHMIKYFIRDEKLTKLYHHSNFSVSYSEYKAAFRKQQFTNVNMSVDVAVNTNLSEAESELDIDVEVMFFCCPMCDKKLSEVKLFRLHLLEHMEYYPYKCTTCSNHFFSKQLYNNHRRDHIGTPRMETKFVLNTELWVDNVISDQQDRLKHLVLMKSSLKHCNFMGCSDVSTDNIQNHFQKCHFARRVFCLNCGYGTFCSDALIRHKSSVHAAQNKKIKMNNKATNTENQPVANGSGTVAEATPGGGVREENSFPNLERKSDPNDGRLVTSCDSGGAAVVNQEPEVHSISVSLCKENFGSVKVKTEPKIHSDDEEIQIIGHICNTPAKKSKFIQSKKASACSKKCGYCDFNEASLAKLREHVKLIHEGLPMKFVNLGKNIDACSSASNRKRCNPVESSSSSALINFKTEPLEESNFATAQSQLPNLKNNSHEFKNNEIFETENELAEEIGVLIYCCYCETKPLTKVQLASHLKDKHENLPLEYYDSRADSYFTLYQDEVLDLNCIGCSLKFEAKLNLAKHMLEQHQAYLCLFCFVNFVDRNLFALHNFREHYQSTAKIFSFVDGRVITEDVEPIKNEVIVF